MGMYTELVFGAALKEDTPEQVINALKYMGGEIEEKPHDFPLPDGRCNRLFRQGSYYFGVSTGVYNMWLDKSSKAWIISTRSNIINYKGEIETFLEWIKPYIAVGSGIRSIYAIVIYEESEDPTIYYLDESEEPIIYY